MRQARDSGARVALTTAWKRRIPLDFFVTLMGHHYPGNVRQLRNFAEQTALRNRTPGPFRAPEILLGAPSPEPAAVDPPPAPPTTHVPPPDVSSATPPTAAGPAPNENHLAVASDALGIAQKTVAKLVPPASLADCVDRAQDATDSLPSLLGPAIAERLELSLVKSGGAKRRAAANLGVSPTTFNKLLERFL